MSKQNLEKTLRRELDVLNDQIDQKIIKGLSYAKEARRHKFILQNLVNLRKSQKSGAGWFGRSLSLTSTFIL